jgi:hypothetical protein
VDPVAAPLLGALGIASGGVSSVTGAHSNRPMSAGFAERSGGALAVALGF